MPPSMKEVMEIKNYIKKDDSDIKDGPALTTAVWALYKGATQNKSATMKAYDSDKSGFVKSVNAAAKRMADKRAAKKAAKA